MNNVFKFIKEKVNYLWRDDKDWRYVADENGCITYYPGKFSLFGYVVSESQKQRMQFEEFCFCIIITSIFLMDALFEAKMNDVFGGILAVTIFLYFIRYRMLLRTFPKNRMPYKLSRRHYSDMWFYGLLLAATALPMSYVGAIVRSHLPFPSIEHVSQDYLYSWFLTLLLGLSIVSVPLWLFCRNLSVLLKMRKIEKAITP